MIKIAGSPYWTTQAVPAQYPYLAEDISCDVAVVGAGATGALCAYALQLAGVDTVLIDAGIVGFGGTGVSSSIMQYDPDFGLMGLSELIGQEKAVRAARACVKGIDEIESITETLNADVGFTRRDGLYYTPCSSGVEKMKQEYLMRKHNGFAVEYLDCLAAAEKFSFRIEGGIYSQGLCGEIDPYRFTHALISEAVESGLRVYENTPVETVSPTSDGISLTAKTRHTVSAKKMVNATGFKAAEDAGHVAMTRTSFTIVTDPVSEFNGWHGQCIIRDDAEPYTYLRTLPDNRILIGGLDSTFVDGRGTVAGFIKLPALVEKKYSSLQERLDTMFPGIKDARPAFRFSGVYGDTLDGLPYVGTKDGYPNVFYDICCGPNGIVYAQLAAGIIRDLYLGGDAQDLDLFAFNRKV